MKLSKYVKYAPSLSIYIKGHVLYFFPCFRGTVIGATVGVTIGTTTKLLVEVQLEF